MNEHNRQFDDLDRRVSDRFRGDLQGLFKPPGAVPPRIDKAILQQAHRRLARPRRLIIRLRWAAGVAAACLAITVLGWWVISGWGVSATQPKSRIASSGEGMALMIESVGDGGRIIPGAALQTSAGEIRSLVLNGRHQVVMNAGTRLSIEPLVDKGGIGCMVNLALGEVYVQVEHDGHPFLVQTAHGRAVITGTTFDVKATEAGTTLVVAEGGVRFESQAGTVPVTAGQQSRIATASSAPSSPVVCDAVALTAWAGGDRSATAMARIIPSDDLLLDDLPSFPSPNARIDLEGVGYAQWVEQNRDWFQRQFPDIFRLKQALVQEGVELDYPDLLLESALVWQFAYPPAGQDRLLAVDDAAILKAASHHDKDLPWLKDRGLLPVAATAPDGLKRMGEAFTLWQNGLAAAADRGKEVPRELLLNSLHACVYLRQTRSLIWLAVEADRYSVPDLSKAQLQALLQAEVTAAGGGASDVIRLLATDRSILPCDSDPYRQLVRRLCDAIAQMAQTEGGLADEMAHSHP